MWATSCSGLWPRHDLDGRELRLDCEPVVAEVDRDKARAHRREPRRQRRQAHAARRARSTSPSRAAAATWCLSIEDDGPGIPDEFKEVVFETFNRGPNVMSMTPGAGIGLVARLALRRRTRRSKLGRGQARREARPSTSSCPTASATPETDRDVLVAAEEQRLEQIGPHAAEECGCLLLADVERPARAGALAEVDGERRDAGSPLARRAPELEGHGGVRVELRPVPVEAALAQSQPAAVEGVSELPVAVERERDGESQGDERSRPPQGTPSAARTTTRRSGTASARTRRRERAAGGWPPSGAAGSGAPLDSAEKRWNLSERRTGASIVPPPRPLTPGGDRRHRGQAERPPQRRVPDVRSPNPIAVEMDEAASEEPARRGAARLRRGP